MSDNEFQYGELIRRYRVETGMTQREVAQKIGLTDSAVAHIERAARTPSPSVAERIADALELSAERRKELDLGLKAIRQRQARKRVEKRANRSPPAKLVGSDGTVTVESLAQELQRNPDLLNGLLDLRAALARPDRRRFILDTLRAWAAED